MVAVMSGQGFGGLVASCINLVTLAMTDSAESAAFIFFLLAFLFTGFILFLYNRFGAENEIYRSFANKLPDEHEKLAQSNQDSNPDMKLMKLIRIHLWPYMLRF